MISYILLLLSDFDHGRITEEELSFELYHYTTYCQTFGPYHVMTEAA